MYKLKISMERENDWKLLVARKFPALKFKVVNSFRFDKCVTNVLFVRANGQKQTVENFLSKFADEVNLLEEGEDYMFLEVCVSETFFEQELFAKHRCFQINGVMLQNLNVVFEVGSYDRENLSRLYNELQKHCSVEMLFLGKARFPTITLSSQQTTVLHLAHENGYYDFPRKINAEELSRKLSLKASTVNEHIRKAENKLVKYFLEQKVR